MKIESFLLKGLMIVAIISCDQSATLSPRPARFIASEQLLKLDGKENLAIGISDLLYEEQNLSNNILMEKALPKSDQNPVYFPENNPKFPLPYYLVPEDEANFIAFNQLDPRVTDQLTMKISGKKHFKLFIHPEFEVQYDFLRSYRYIGSDQTEFLASPLFHYNSLVVWNKNNMGRKPFIAKVNLEQIQDHTDFPSIESEIERVHIAQKVFKKINFQSLKFFSETSAITVNKTFTQQPNRSISQQFVEIPDELVNSEKKWLSFSTLVSRNKKAVPLIMSVIKKSSLTPYDFIKSYMIDGYLALYEEMSLKNGINFESRLQYLALETSSDLTPTGKWVLKDLSTVWPDIITMIKKKAPVEDYMQHENAKKFNIKSSLANAVENYFFIYRPLVFDVTLAEISRHTTSLTPKKIQELKSIIDLKFTNLINLHMNLNLKDVPTKEEIPTIKDHLIKQIVFEASWKEIKSSANLKTFIENKKEQNEWVEFSSPHTKSKFYLTNYGVVEITDNRLSGLGLFNSDEKDEYDTNNKMLTIFQMTDIERPDKTSPFGMLTDFINGPN